MKIQFEIEDWQLAELQELLKIRTADRDRMFSDSAWMKSDESEYPRRIMRSRLLLDLKTEPTF